MGQKIEIGQALIPAAVGAALGGLIGGRMGAALGGAVVGGLALAGQAIPDTARDSVAGLIREGSDKLADRIDSDAGGSAGILYNGGPNAVLGVR